MNVSQSRKFMKKSGFTLISEAFKGFTLIELLVVMAILGILSTVGLNSFRLSQMKARDAKRKSDLGQVQRALEMYYSDHGNYPAAGAAGTIHIGVSDLAWGDGEMTDAEAPETVYLKELPKDPSGNLEYCYFYQSSPISYKLYARLENSQDQSCLGGVAKCNDPQGTCGGKAYNYGVSSANITP